MLKNIDQQNAESIAEERVWEEVIPGKQFLTKFKELISIVRETWECGLNL